MEHYNFARLVEQAHMKKEEDLMAFLEGFFTPTQYLNYDLESDDLDENEKKAIETLFLKEGDLFDRVDQALSYHYLCKEAVFVVYLLVEDPIVEDAFLEIMAHQHEFITLSGYGRICLYECLNMYVDFLMSINNLTKASRIQDILFDYDEKRRDYYMERYAMMYASLEEEERFFERYQNYGLKSPRSYILLMVVLLKHDSFDRAKDVYLDLIDSYPYFAYLDCLWQLETVEEEGAGIVFETVQSCIQEINAIPHFFSWCKDNKERIYHS